LPVVPEVLSKIPLMLSAHGRSIDFPGSSRLGCYRPLDRRGVIDQVLELLSQLMVSSGPEIFIDLFAADPVHTWCHADVVPRLKVLDTSAIPQLG